MKHIHVKLDERLVDEINAILPFHGGISHAIRIALKNFVRDYKTGRLKLNDSIGGSPNEASFTDRTD